MPRCEEGYRKEHDVIEIYAKLTRLPNIFINGALDNQLVIGIDICKSID